MQGSFITEQEELLLSKARKGWKESFDLIIEHLSQDTTCTEDEFLEIGRHLQEFKTNSNLVIEETIDISKQVSEDKIKNSIENLNNLSQKLLKHFEVDDDVNIEKNERLKTIREIIDNVKDNLSGFKKIVKTLKMLSISTQIESARLGNDEAGFSALAGDVEKLSNDIEEKTTGIFVQSDQLDSFVVSVVEKSKELMQKQGTQSSDIVNKLNSNLETVKIKHDESIELINDVSGKSMQVSEDISKIVSNIQFHDITRQQLEHVMNSISDLKSDLESFEVYKSENRKEEFYALIRDITSLESSQLINSSNEFHNAIEEIKSGLAGIANNLVDLSSEVNTLSGVKGKGSQSFLNKIEASVEEIFILLNSNKTIYDEINVSMSEVGKTVHDLADSIRLIEEIGEEVEMIAINASIKAAHTGSEGAALGVIADAIQKLSAEAMEQTQQTSEPLRKIEEIATALIKENDKEKSLDADNEYSSIAEEISVVITQLDAADKESTELIKNLSGKTHEIATDISNMIDSINVDSMLMGDTAKLSAILNDIREEVTHVIGENFKEYSRKRIDKISERYTMLSERRVHSIYNSSDSELNQNHSLIDGSEQFDENVELF